jgi:hypothetical protein
MNTPRNRQGQKRVQEEHTLLMPVQPLGKAYIPPGITHLRPLIHDDAVYHT